MKTVFPRHTVAVSLRPVFSEIVEQTQARPERNGHASAGTRASLLATVAPDTHEDFLPIQLPIERIRDIVLFDHVVQAAHVFRHAEGPLVVSGDLPELDPRYTPPSDGRCVVPYPAFEEYISHCCRTGVSVRRGYKQRCSFGVPPFSSLRHPHVTM